MTHGQSVPIEWLNCPAGDMWKYKGKEGYPTRSFLVAAAVTREVYEVSVGFPGTTNDLSKAHFSPLMSALRNGSYSQWVFDVRCTDGSTKQEGRLKV